MSLLYHAYVYLGFLILACTIYILAPVYQMHGNQISVRTLDLNLPFEQVAGQMDRIAESHFDDVKKYL